MFLKFLQLIAENTSRDVLLDNSVTFEPHIKMLQLAKAVGILNKVKTHLNKPTLVSLYYAFFHSQLHYGLLTWSSTFHSYYNKIITLQNKAIKNVCGGK